MSDVEQLKEQAGIAACRFVKDGMVLGTRYRFYREVFYHRDSKAGHRGRDEPNRCPH